MNDTADGRPRTEDGREFLKMKELVDATGLPKSTILHYVNQGLLPAPVRTGRNMAYYDPACVERVRLIRQLQAYHRLPLAAIRDVLEGRSPDTEIPLLLEFREYVFGPADRPTMDLEQFCTATGLSADQVEREIGAGVLVPLEEGRFDQDDVALGRVRKAALDLGIGPREVRYYRRAAEDIVDHEMALRERVISEMSFEQMATTTLDMTRGARVIRAYAIERAFQRRIQSFTRFEQSRADDTETQPARRRRKGKGKKASVADRNEEDKP